MSDPLDDLRAALQAVEPSPTFETKTLAHVDHQRDRARQAKRAWLVMVPIAAAAVVVVAIFPRSGGLEDQAAVHGPAIVSKVSEPITRRPLAAVELPAHRAFRARTAKANEAVWTIPENAHADQAIAVRRLMTLIRAKRIEVPSEPAAIDESGLVPALAPIELKPIVIAPLPNGQGGGGER